MPSLRLVSLNVALIFSQLGSICPLMAGAATEWYTVTTPYSLPLVAGVGIASTPNGTLYVTATDLLYELSPLGDARLVAGGGSHSGFVDGQGSDARFNYLTELTLDPRGNILVIDHYNHCIRKVTPGGQVTTFAGGSGTGNREGPAAQATFFWLAGIACDQAGNVYVTDSGDLAVKKISADGYVSTLVRGTTDMNGVSDFLPMSVAVDTPARCTFSATAGKCSCFALSRTGAGPCCGTVKFPRTPAISRWTRPGISTFVRVTAGSGNCRPVAAPSGCASATT